MVAVALAATAVAGTAYSINQQEKAASASRAAAATRQRQQEVQATRSRRAGVREAQRRRAMLRSQAQALGAVGGSGFSGAIGSISSQLGSNLGFSTQMTGMSRDITQFGMQEATALSNAQVGSSVASLAMSAMPYAPQIQSGLNKITGQVQ